MIQIFFSIIFTFLFAVVAVVFSHATGRLFATPSNLLSIPIFFIASLLLMYAYKRR